MKTVKWINGHIEVEPPKKPKKISGTFFPTVLGFDPWKSPFEAWCKSTRTWEKAFEGNKFTNAGQIIEPKVFDFLRTSLGYGNRVATPTDLYGKDYFKKTRGDFFPDDPIFSGMDDALILDETLTNFEYVVEVKTVQIDGRSGTLEERWEDGKAPDYQALQAALYAYKRGIDKVLMVAVALEDNKGDYEHPEQVVPSFANGNVYIDEFKVSERYPNFDMYIAKATQWWNDYVLTGISPGFDEKKDAEILKALRTNTIDLTDITLNELVAQAETLKLEIDEIKSSITAKEKEQKAILDEIKKIALMQFRDGDTKVSFKGKSFEWVLSKSDSTELDTESLVQDMGEDFMNKYTKQKTSYRLTTSRIKED
jgi:predicted phage-related endonuclease